MRELDIFLYCKKLLISINLMDYHQTWLSLLIPPVATFLLKSTFVQSPLSNICKSIKQEGFHTLVY
jgi:hypothetical protein